MLLDLLLLVGDLLEGATLLESFSITQCIQSVVACGTAGADACEHHYLCLLALHE